MFFLILQDKLSTVESFNQRSRTELPSPKEIEHTEVKVMEIEHTEVKVEVAKTTITKKTVTQVMTSVTPVIGAEDVEGPAMKFQPSEDIEGSATNFHCLYETAHDMIGAYQRDVVCNGDLQTKDGLGDLQDNAKVS